MKIAVVTCTRDRLSYTERCFASLRRFAGCEYDHYVWDNGSEDGTLDWLHSQLDSLDLYLVGTDYKNIGVGQGIANLITEAKALDDYDVIVKFDNDCLVDTPGTLSACARYALSRNAIVSPQILGLRSTPEIKYLEGQFGYTGHIGGIFLAAPTTFYDGWQDSTSAKELPLWGGDDVMACSIARDRGMPVGYLTNYAAYHYRTTDGQHEDYPDYFKRRVEEGGPA